jgi:hypothetical protein
MQAASLSASNGIQWIKDGWRIFRRQPLALFTWAMFISFLLMVSTIIPPIGPIIFIVLMPAISFATLSICRHVSAGKKLSASNWMQAFQTKGTFKRLLVAGVLYMATNLLAGLLAFLPFSGQVSEALQSMNAANDLMPLLDAVQEPMMLFGFLYVIVAAFFWYCPALIGWHQRGLIQSLLYSAIACWRNKWAFIVYGACWVAIFLGVDLATGLLVSVGLSVKTAATLQIPINILVGSVLYCSFYPSYVSVFESLPPAEPLPADAE